MCKKKSTIIYQCKIKMGCITSLVYDFFFNRFINFRKICQSSLTFHLLLKYVSGIFNMAYLTFFFLNITYLLDKIEFYVISIDKISLLHLIGS